MSRFIGLETLVRSRLIRLLLAAALIAFGVSAFLPYVTYRIAPSAFVNAELMRVTAPITGRLSQELPRKGDFINHAESLRLIESLSPDRRHLLDLDRQYAVAKEHAELARKQLNEVALLDRELTAHTEAYRMA